jgi:hypothetical protein
MPSIISTYLKRAMSATQLFRLKKPIPFANTIRVAVAVLLVMGVVGASNLLTSRESSRPARTAVPAHAAVQEAQRPQVPASQATAKKAEVPTAKAITPSSTLVTITGCLEQRDETFRLKDTDGADVPKSRNWKTAFLKKGPAPIEVIDTANRLKLNDHVGQRVSVTGTLVEREMQVRSLQRVAASCSKNPSA